MDTVAEFAGEKAGQAARVVVTAAILAVGYIGLIAFNIVLGIPVFGLVVLALTVVLLAIVGCAIASPFVWAYEMICFVEKQVTVTQILHKALWEEETGGGRDLFTVTEWWFLTSELGARPLHFLGAAIKAGDALTVTVPRWPLTIGVIGVRNLKR